MFGFISRETYNAVRDRRDLLERRLAERLVELRTSEASVRRLERQLVELQQSHERQMATILKHLAPEPSTPAAGSEREPLADPTPDEIRAQPASTKREMFVREQAAKRAQALLDKNAGREAAKRRDELLTDEERKELERPYDDTLGIRVDEPQSPEEAPAQ